MKYPASSWSSAAGAVTCLLLFASTVQALSSSSSRSTRKAVPTIEKVRRRKSPALWREDLVPSASSVSVETKPRQPARVLLQHPPEVMAPCGGWPQVKAAVANGADAVYVGLTAFSARARAANFSPAELNQAVQYCHLHQVKIYVAINTLVFQNELPELIQLLQICQNAHVDAIIVQDHGLAAQLVQHVSPGLEIHASTQQTVTSASGVDFCAQHQKATRVVLGRELSVAEIAQVTAQTDTEIEAFCHGALCVSYSGQCFSSEAWGGRSANRGQCAQACRLPYGLIANGELRDLQDMSYLLSPQDLCGLDQVKELTKAGVSCLKIEGRLKDETYVAATTRAYRNAVDEAWEELVAEGLAISDTSSHQQQQRSPTGLAEPQLQVSRNELAQVFSRGQDENFNGLTPGFFEGSQHQMLVRGRSPRHRGVHVGRVLEHSSSKNGLRIDLNDGIELKRGDGIVVDRGRAEEEELGGPIFDVIQNDQEAIVHFGRSVQQHWKETDEQARKTLGFPLAPKEAHVWRTSDAQVEKKLRRLASLPPPEQTLGTVQVSVSGSVGTPLKVTLSDGRHVAEGLADQDLQKAKSAGLEEAKVRKAIGTLGNTAWTLENEANVSALESDVWCPVKSIKEARRRAVEELERLTSSVDTSATEDSPSSLKEITTISDAKEIASRLLESVQPPDQSVDSRPKTKLSVMARNLEQVECLCEMIEQGEEQIDEIMIDFLEVDGMRDAVNRIRGMSTDSSTRVVLASPRIIKPEESGIWRTLLRLEPDALLVRSPGLLQQLNDLGGSGATIDLGAGNDGKVNIPQLLGDFSLNVANPLSAFEFLENGLDRVTAAYDLSANAITELAQSMDASRLEVVAHCKMPIFHTEHCVFARFLSKGNSYLDCGHVCTRNNVHLRDETGADNLVLADMGCRNTVFAAQAQSGVHTIPEWQSVGVGRLRIELVDEGPVDIPSIVHGYLGVLDGSKRPRDVWESLQFVRDSNGRAPGVSFGSLRNQVERRAGST